MSDTPPTRPPDALPPLPPAMVEMLDAATEAFPAEIVAALGGITSLRNTITHIITSAAHVNGTGPLFAGLKPLSDTLGNAAISGLHIGWALRDSEVAEENLHQFRQQAQER